MSAEKVVNIIKNPVNEQIEMFLKKKGYKSQNTANAYKKDIERFFKVVRNKEPHFLSVEDCQLTLDDFEYYISQLHDSEELNNKTINRSVSSVRNLLKYLNSKKIGKDRIVNEISFLDQIERLPEKENRYGIFSVEEALTAANIVRNIGKKREIKYFLILFAVDTCLRLSAILNLKWSDFEEREDGVLVKAVDKGNSDARLKISHKFYDELKEIKVENEDRVFPISEVSVNHMMDTIRSEMEIPENRNLVFHSFRKTGVTFQYRISNDILQAKKAARHKNIQNTLLYLDEEDYGASGMISMGRELDFELYKKVDHEILIETISEMKNFQLLLNIKLNEKMKKK